MMNKAKIIEDFLEKNNLKEHELTYWKHKVSSGFSIKKFMSDFIDFYHEQITPQTIDLVKLGAVYTLVTMTAEEQKTTHPCDVCHYKYESIYSDICTTCRNDNKPNEYYAKHK